MLTTVLLAHSVAGRVDEIGTAESTLPIRQCFVVFVTNRVTSGVISEKVLTISEPHFHGGASGGWGEHRNVFQEKSFDACSRG